MIELLLIGYWHSDEEPDYPDPAWFVDSSWDMSERKRVIDYLKSGYKFCRYCGYSWCRFRCRKRGPELGDAELTDGVYYWPEGFVHYVEDHDVKPPEDFLEHVRKNPIIYQKRLMKNIGIYSNIQSHKEWWKNQKGYAKGKSFKSPGYSGTHGKLWLIDTKELTYVQIRFLRKSNFLLDHPLSKIKSDLSYKKMVLLDEECEYCHAADLIREARVRGLKLKIDMTGR